MQLKQAPKFLFLDGLRGLSALYVVLYHAVIFTGYENSVFPSFLKPFTFVLGYGHYAVSVFIVLSGFCLTIPVTTNNNRLRGGFQDYIKRRFRWIVPPYYFALVFFIFLIWNVPVLQTKSGTAWDNKIPFNWESIVTHFLLIHNLSYEWIFKIDGPMWSVATEWQIYFLFPVLLFIYRKTNLLLSVLFGISVGVLLSPVITLIHPWFLGLFSLGDGGSHHNIFDRFL